MLFSLEVQFSFVVLNAFSSFGDRFLNTVPAASDSKAPGL